MEQEYVLNGLIVNGSSNAHSLLNGSSLKSTRSIRIENQPTTSFSCIEERPTKLLSKPYRHMDSKSRKETVVTYDFTEEPIPPNHCCCGRVKVQRGCKVVAVFSLLAVLTNGILYFLGISRLGLNKYLEMFILTIDFFAVFFLLLGLSKQRSGMLKPYLFFNTLWSLWLSVLFLMCLWQIIKGRDLSKSILSNLHSLRSSEAQAAYQHRLRHTRQETGGVACLVTTMMMLALICVIVVDCIFLHVVYRTFHFFAYKEDKAKEKERRSVAQNGSI